MACFLDPSTRRRPFSTGTAVINAVEEPRTEPVEPARRARRTALGVLLLAADKKKWCPLGGTRRWTSDAGWGCVLPCLEFYSNILRTGHRLLAAVLQLLGGESFRFMLFVLLLSFVSVSVLCFRYFCGILFLI
ncbi:hypothetical protein B0H19DRAFT_1181435 [Mycena capillaripes]|nr:hypothetical protein B0H19DRAFT_1181435 [Mycena capillaripes]